MRKSLKSLAVGALLIGMTGCTGASNSDGGSTSTYDISGTMGGLSAMSVTQSKLTPMDYAKYYAASTVELFSSKGYGENQASAASACADGKYYRVLCSAWSTPPVAAYGDVSCSGANSGGFTVAGLPLGSEVSCFVRVSTDGSSFSPFATLEIPAAAMGGTTDTMTPTGNVTLSVSVGTDGSVSTEISSGATAGGSTTTTVTTSDFNGYYGISCDASSAEENARCKCMMSHDYSGLYNSEDACITDLASKLTAPSAGAPYFGNYEVVDIRVYSGAVGGSGLDTNGDGTADIAAGGTIHGISVWGGSCTDATTCSSLRVSAGGDSLPTFGGVISWTGDTPITWPTGNLTKSIDSTTITIALSSYPIPADTATRAQWLTWLQNIVANSGWTCNMGGTTKNATDASVDGFCLGNFVWQVMDQFRRDSILPRVSYRHQCTNWSSCGTPTPVANYLEVEGIDFDNSGNVDTAHSMGKRPAARYVLEQFIPLSSGGGGFKQNNKDMRWIPCVAGTGSDSTSGIYSCPSGANGIECGVVEEMAIKLLPSGTTGVYYGGFARANTVNKGVIRGGTADGSVVSGSFDAYAKCVSAFGASGGNFTAKFTKMAN